METGVAAPIGDRLVLQIALAALVADRAIERMVDEEELHHPFARPLYLFRRGGDHLIIRGRQRARRLRLRRPRRNLDQAHAAIAGDRQPLVIAETRNFLPRRLRSEEHTSELPSLMRISYAVFCLK